MEAHLHHTVLIQQPNLRATSLDCRHSCECWMEMAISDCPVPNWDASFRCSTDWIQTRTVIWTPLKSVRRKRRNLLHRERTEARIRLLVVEPRIVRQSLLVSVRRMVGQNLRAMDLVCQASGEAGLLKAEVKLPIPARWKSN